MKIVPALLADNFEEFLFRFRQAEAFADYVQVDLMGESIMSVWGAGFSLRMILEKNIICS